MKLAFGALFLLLGYLGLLLALWQAGKKTGWKTWTKLLFSVAIIPAGVGLVVSAGLYADRGSPVKKQMAAMANQLVEADKKGDVMTATDMQSDSIAVFRQLNPTGTPALENRDCLLAAVHLSDGITAVMNGGSWASRHRFDAAMSDCK